MTKKEKLIKKIIEEVFKNPLAEIAAGRLYNAGITSKDLWLANIEGLYNPQRISTANALRDLERIASEVEKSSKSL